MIIFIEERAMAFYNDIAGFYDSMFPFDVRLKKQSQIFQIFLRDFPMHTVLEAGCGTGLQSLALCQNGLNVTGIDLSSEMIAQARVTARNHQANIVFREGSFQDVRKLDQAGSFDAIFILGNSVAHILSGEELRLTLQAFHTTLSQSGLLIIQLLNYQPILRNQNRILGINYSHEDQYIRFYDFLENGSIRFNILKIVRSQDEVQHELFSEILYPWVMDEMREALEDSGFELLYVTEELDKKDFDLERSEVLSLVLRKISL